MKKYIFTEEEKKKIKEAVEALEKESCGEIVPYFARKSDEYDEVPWQLASVFGLSGLFFILFLSYTWSLPSFSSLELSLGIISMMAIGFFLPRSFPAIRRGLASKEKMLEMVELRAREAFLNEKVYETQEKVGILLYISRLEHLVVILGDEGINEKVKHEDWQQIIDLVTKGLKENKIGDGITSAISQCKKLLLKNGFVRKSSDTNEISDDLRIND